MKTLIAIGVTMEYKSVSYVHQAGHGFLRSWLAFCPKKTTKIAKWEDDQVVSLNDLWAFLILIINLMPEKSIITTTSDWQQRGQLLQLHLMEAEKSIATTTSDGSRESQFLPIHLTAAERRQFLLLQVINKHGSPYQGQSCFHCN
jgi:hypothetical protein